MRINLKQFKTNGYSGIAVITGLVTACMVLMYILLHDPYKDLHTRIFTIAEKVNNYYREKPNYWKLSTETAMEDDLIGDIKEAYSEYDFSIGQGINGEPGLPINASFDIALKHLSKSACISLSEKKIAEEKRLSLLKITIITPEKNTEFSWGEDPKLPVEKYAARNICSPQENAIIWTFQ